MTGTGPSQVTRLLAAFSAGDESALDELTPLVYEELERRARAQMRGESAGHTLSTTGLVHEAFVRLAAQSSASYANRGQFFAVASMTTRRVLVNWARDKSRQTRGGELVKVSLQDAHRPRADRAGAWLMPGRIGSSTPAGTGRWKNRTTATGPMGACARCLRPGNGPEASWLRAGTVPLQSDAASSWEAGHSSSESSS